MFLPKALVLSLFLSSLAWAHNGEDHGAPSAASTSLAALPRANAQGDALELVAVAEPRGLTLYLNALQSDAPLAAATVELEVDSHPVALTSQADGVYRSPLQLAPGKHPLVLTVSKAEMADLLEATLTIPSPAEKPGSAPPTQWGALFAVIAGIAAFLGGGLLVLRRRA